MAISIGELKERILMAWCPIHGARVTVGCVYCEPERRKTAFTNWVANMRPWHLTITLTFDPKRRTPVPPGAQRGAHPLSSCISPRVTDDAGRNTPPIRLSDVALTGDVAQHRVKKWLKDGQERLGRRISGVVCLENHKNGAPHFHGLLGLDGDLQDGDIRELGQLWFKRNGYNRLEIPRSVNDVASYAAKYMSKDIKDGGVIFWPSTGPLSAKEGQLRMRSRH